MHKIWIEAALNGPWSRKRQPGIGVLNRGYPVEGLRPALIERVDMDDRGPGLFSSSRRRS